MKAPIRTQSTAIRTAPVSDNPPAPTTSGPNSSDYYLTSAKATIYTGNDNKEQPSQVQMQISLAEGVGSYMVPTWEYREFPVNSSTELPFKFFYDGNYYQSKMCLTNAENAGVKIFISYSPNFLLDAWKIVHAFSESWGLFILRPVGNKLVHCSALIFTTFLLFVQFLAN